jgi:hypothetical protein
MSEADVASDITLTQWNARDHRHQGPCEELICCVCLRVYSIWYADNDIWNAVMRDESGRDLVPFACAKCFLLLAAPVLPIARITHPVV